MWRADRLKVGHHLLRQNSVWNDVPLWAPKWLHYIIYFNDKESITHVKNVKSTATSLETNMTSQRNVMASSLPYHYQRPCRRFIFLNNYSIHFVTVINPEYFSSRFSLNLSGSFEKEISIVSETETNMKVYSCCGLYYF